jgi:hypothetical protein
LVPFDSDPMRDTERFKSMRDALRDAVSSPAPTRRERRNTNRWRMLRRRTHRRD